MPSLLSAGTRMFRTRNPERDANTDKDRFMTVRRSMLGVIENAEKERQGLQMRLDVYYAQATNLIDNSGEFGERSREDEQAIAAAEENAAVARRRLGMINTHIEELKAVLATLDATVAKA